MAGGSEISPLRLYAAIGITLFTLGCASPQTPRRLASADSGELTDHERAFVIHCEKEDRGRAVVTVDENGKRKLTCLLAWTEGAESKNE